MYRVSVSPYPRQHLLFCFYFFNRSQASECEVIPYCGFHLHCSWLAILSIICLLVISITSWRRQWQPTPVLLSGKSHGWRSLVGCSPWGPEELDMTEWLHFHFSLSCIGEGNDNPLQCSCLENPRDGGAWWAAVYGVTQSQTRLKPLMSSSSITSLEKNLFKSLLSFYSLYFAVTWL